MAHFAGRSSCCVDVKPASVELLYQGRADAADAAAGDEDGTGHRVVLGLIDGWIIGGDVDTV